MWVGRLCWMVAPTQVAEALHQTFKPWGIILHRALMRGVIEVVYYLAFGVGTGIFSFYYYVRREGMSYRGESSKSLGFPEIYGFANVIAVLGGALSFLLVFRLNWAYTHWWEARGAFGEYNSKLKDLMIMMTSREMSVSDKGKARECLHKAKCVLKVHSAALADELCYGPIPYDVAQHGSLFVTEKQISNVLWFQENLTKADFEAFDDSKRANKYLRTPHRVLLCQKWLTCAVDDAIRVGLFKHYDILIAQQHLAKLLELYYTMLKVKMTAMPSAIHLLVQIMKCTYCLMIFPQFMAYAFVMNLTDEQRAKNAPALSSFFPIFYVAITTVGIIYFVTMHIIATELDDPFGDDLSDFPLTEWTFQLWKELDTICAFDLEDDASLLAVQDKGEMNDSRNKRSATLTGLLPLLSLRKETSRLWPQHQEASRIIISSRPVPVAGQERTQAQTKKSGRHASRARDSKDGETAAAAERGPQYASQRPWLDTPHHRNTQKQQLLTVEV